MASAIPSRFSLSLALLIPAIARAEAAASSQDLGASVVQMLLGLAAVIALLFASLWVLKRLSAPRGEAAGLLRVIAGTAVGARERVVIVEVGGTWLVLGVAPGRVNALAEIPRSTPSVPPTATQATQANNFATRLRRMVDRHHAP
jgi:flagellar protein FliO/FliZ